ncbi:TRAP transporter substrate-binding protein [Aestuariispira insulae]|uniref:TRAP-type C4-dicarboxylate transport system substrate-binding protein n=1 Tax=Aestuariispira insulae TaxID=1461337 RepID=A0A3D9H9B6_9PROT|nr:TRAP transporter substrate-binding protein [Aestuariispira insulae]RED45761.1 TRAP-type C4-dicarboxylate transport system substrate-binding protein [Aestuariispira insulae]
MKRMISLGAAIGVAMGAAVLGTGAAAAETIQLKLSHFLPSSHPTQKDFLEPWAKELEQRTGGKVKIEIYPAGSAFGHVAKQYDQVRAGVVDIAHGLTGFPRGRLPRTLIMDLPFLAKSSDAASRTLWELYPEYLAEEYKGLKVLALHAHNPGLIHTRGKQVKTIDDLKGLRLRTPSQAISMMLEQLGATPVGLPPTQVYENLQKGVIDGNVFPYEAVHGFKLFEVLDYHLDAKAYTTSFYFVMNEKKYNALPDEVRAVIDDISGESLVAKFGPWWNEWDKPGIEDIKAKGNPITTLDDAQRAEWRKQLQPTIDGYLDAAEKAGVGNAREIYDAAVDTVAKYD